LIDIVDDQDFQRHVTNGPREHATVLYITALDQQFGCTPCHEFKNVISQISNLYEKLRYKGSSTPRHNLFFVMLDYKQTTGMSFQALGIQHVPHLLFLQPGSESFDLPSLLASVGGENTFGAAQQGMTAAGLIHWIADRSKVSLDADLLKQLGDIEKQVDQRKPSGGSGGDVSPTAIMFLLGAVGIALLVRFRSYPIVYFALSSCVFLFSISGGMFNIIREVPWYQYDRNTGRVTYFTSGNQMQLGYEGYIMGALQVAAGLVMVALSAFAIRIKSSALRNAALTGLLASLYWLTFMIRSLYRFKMSYYNDGLLWNLPSRFSDF